MTRSYLSQADRQKMFKIIFWPYDRRPTRRSHGGGPSHLGMVRKPRGQRVVDAYFSRDHFDDRETCCPLIALPSDVMRGSDAVKGAYREVFEKLVEIFMDDLDEPQRRERALALAALCVGGIVTPKCIDDPALADDLRRAAHRQALRIGGWTAVGGKNSIGGVSLAG